ncbi:MAG: VanZ family protein [Bacteroidales bacterium]
MSKNIIFPLTWTIGIIIGSTISGNTLDHVSLFKIPFIDKIIHFIWYYVLYIAWYSFLLKQSTKYIKFYNRIILLICIIGFGFILELLQQYVSIKRSADLYDFIADCIGAFTALITYFNVYQSKVFGKYL